MSICRLFIKRLSDSDLSDIFSLGFTIAQLEKSNDRGIRLEAMHMRGIEDMEEEDIMQYFNEFEPSAIEWIDDESCKFKYSCFRNTKRRKKILMHLECFP